MIEMVGSGYGRVVSLQVPTEAAGDVRATLPFWWAPAVGKPEQVWQVPTSSTAQTVVRAMELWIAEHAVDAVFVHAAVVAVGGHAILLPGRSGAGKTTLCAALLDQGAAYLSDEYAVLGTDGMVHPYPRPLWMRTGAGRVTMPAADFGAPTAAGPHPVGLVAVIRHEREARWAVRACSPADTVLHLLDNTVSARTHPAAALDALGSIDAVGIEGVRGEAGEAARELLDRF